MSMHRSCALTRILAACSCSCSCSRFPCRLNAPLPSCPPSCPSPRSSRTMPFGRFLLRHCKCPKGRDKVSHRPQHSPPAHPGRRRVVLTPEAGSRTPRAPVPVPVPVPVPGGVELPSGSFCYRAGDFISTWVKALLTVDGGGKTTDVCLGESCLPPTPASHKRPAAGSWGTVGSQRTAEWQGKGVGGRGALGPQSATEEERTPESRWSSRSGL